MTQEQIPPVVSIIIPNFNGEKFLERCLKSIFLEKRKSFEVIIVDDCSIDNSVSLIRKLRKTEINKKLKLIVLKNRVWTAKATNIGVKNSKGKYLLILDNDTKIKKGWFNEVVQFFKKNKRAGVAQPKLLKMGTNKFDYAGDYLGPFGFLIERARGTPDIGQFNKTEKIFALKSAAMLVRRDVFNKLGGFDENYKIFWEETDFCWRTWLIDYQVLFAPQIVVWHAFGTKEKGVQTYIHHQVYYNGCKNTITTLIKNLGNKKLLFILPVNAGCWLFLAIGFLLRLDIKKSFALVKGVFWNIIYLPQILIKRKEIQSKRKIADQELFAIVGDKRNFPYYFGKGIAYIMGKPF